MKAQVGRRSGRDKTKGKRSKRRRRRKKKESLKYDKESQRKTSTNSEEINPAHNNPNDTERF